MSYRHYGSGGHGKIISDLKRSGWRIYKGVLHYPDSRRPGRSKCRRFYAKPLDIPLEAKGKKVAMCGNCLALLPRTLNELRESAKNLYDKSLLQSLRRVSRSLLSHSSTGVLIQNSGAINENYVVDRIRRVAPKETQIIQNLVLPVEGGCREIDIVVLVPNFGIAFIEVKSGQIKFRSDGAHQGEKNPNLLDCEKIFDSYAATIRQIRDGEISQSFNEIPIRPFIFLNETDLKSQRIARITFGETAKLPWELLPYVLDINEIATPMSRITKVLGEVLERHGWAKPSKARLMRAKKALTGMAK